MADDLTRKVIELILRAKNEMGTELEAAAGGMKGFSASALNVGRDLATIGGGMLLAGGGVVAGITALATAAANYEQLNTALVTGAGESKGAIAGISQAMLDMAVQVGESPQKLAQGMYMIESAGFHGQSGLQVLQASAIAAKVGMADQATVANAVTSALNAYNLSGDQATKVTDILTQTVATGKMHMEDLAGSLGTVLPAAAAAKIPLSEIGAAIATMTAQGTPAAEAATYLRQSILMLEKPSSAAQAAMESIGLTADQVGNTLQNKGLPAALELIQNHLNNTFPQGGVKASAALEEMFGGARSGQAALELMNGHLEAFKTNVENMRAATDGAGKTMEGWTMVQKDAAFGMEQVKAQLAVTTIQLGQAFLPALQQVIATVLPIIQHIGAWAAAHPDLVAKIGTTIAAVLLIGGAIFLVVGFIVQLVGAFAAVGAFMAGPTAAAIAGVIGSIISIAAPIVAIIAVVVLLYEAWTNNWGGIRDIANKAVEWVAGALDKVFEVINKARSLIGMAPIDWRAQWEQLKGGIESAANTVGGAASTATGDLKTSLTAKFNEIKSSILGPMGDMSSGGVNAMAGMKEGMLGQAAQLQAGLAAGTTPGAGLLPNPTQSTAQLEAYASSLGGPGGGGPSKADLAYQHQLDQANLGFAQANDKATLSFKQSMDKANLAEIQRQKLADLTETHRQAMEFLAKQHNDIMQGIKRAHGSTADEMVRYNDAKAGEMEQYNTQKLQLQQQNSQAKLSEMAGDYNQKMALAQAQHAQKIDAIVDYHQEKMGQMVTATQTATTQMAQTFAMMPTGMPGVAAGTPGAGGMPATMPGAPAGWVVPATAGKPAAPTTINVTVAAGAVQVAGNNDTEGWGAKVGDVIAKALEVMAQTLNQSERQASVGAPALLPGNPW